MSISPETEAMMLAYVYGELEEDAKATFEGKLASDPDLKAEVEGLMATRDLLDGDMAYGLESGLDEPPPHLTEAIFRAEALTRPPEIRGAAVSGSRPASEESVFKRFGAWLLGGGALVGAAAAATLVVGLSKSEAPSMDEAMAPTAVAPAEPESVAKAEAEPAEEPTATPEEADIAADKLVEGEAPLAKEGAVDADEGFKEAKRALRKARPATKSAGKRAAVPLKARDRKDMATLMDDFEDQLDPPGALVAEDTGNTRGGLAGMERAAAQSERPADGAMEQKPAPPPMPQQAAPVAAPAPEPSKAPKKMRKSDGALAAKPKPRPARSIGGSSYGAGGGSVSSSGPPPLPKGASEAMRERRSKAKSKKVNKKSVSKIASAKQEKRRQDTQLYLASGFRELELGRPSDALLLFEKAEKEDPKGKIHGIKPIVGQMLAWQALGRPKQVLRLFTRIEGSGPTADGAVQGFLVAGGAAEKLGKLNQAERIYRALGKTPKGRAQAQAGLQRVRAARASYDSADAAAESPQKN